MHPRHYLPLSETNDGSAPQKVQSDTRFLTAAIATVLIMLGIVGLASTWKAHRAWEAGEVVKVRVASVQGNGRSAGSTLQVMRVDGVAMQGSAVLKVQLASAQPGEYARGDELEARWVGDADDGRLVMRPPNAVAAVLCALLIVAGLWLVRLFLRTAARHGLGHGLERRED